MQPFLPLTASFLARFGRIQDFCFQNLVKGTQNVGEDQYLTSNKQSESESEASYWNGSILSPEDQVSKLVTLLFKLNMLPLIK